MAPARRLLPLCWAVGVCLLLLASLGTVAPGVPSAVSDAATAPLSFASQQLSSAAASLASGAGPADGAPWTCASAGSSSEHCATPTTTSVAAGYVWTSLTSRANAGPDQTDVSMTFDTGDSYVLLFGGQNYLFQSQAYTWTYANGTWTNVTAQVTGAPPAVSGDVLAYSPPANAVVMFGGIYSSGGYSSYTYTYHDLVWTNLSSTAGAPPSGRVFSAFTYDTYDKELVLFGGEVAGGISIWVHDTWVFEAGVWVNISSASPYMPSMIDGPILTDDPGHGAILFGAAVWGFTVHASTYLFYQGVFHNLTSSLSAEPPTLYYGGGAYVATVGGVFVYGGYTLIGGGAYVLNPQTWLFNGATWTNVTFFVSPSGMPGDDYGGTAYDPIDQSILSYGGMGTIPEDTQYTWALNGPPLPTANATPRVTDVGLPVEFTGAGLPGLSPSTALWTFGDGGSSSVSSMGYAYTAPGLYTATYAVTSYVGVNATASVSVYVYPAPTASIVFAPSSPVVGGPLTIVAIASGGQGPYTYAWNFGDGGTSTELSPAHAYATAGTYTVTLNVTDSLGGVARATDTVRVASGSSGSSSAVNPLSGVGAYLVTGLVVEAAIALVLAALLLRARRPPTRPPTPFSPPGTPPPGGP